MTQPQGDRNGIGPTRPDWTASFNSYSPTPPESSGLATTVLVLGVFAAVTAIILIGVLVALIGLVLAPVAWYRIRSSNGRLRGGRQLGIGVALCLAVVVGMSWLLSTSDGLFF